MAHGHTDSRIYTTDCFLAANGCDSSSLHRLQCTCDSGLNHFCIKSAENEANKKCNWRFLTGYHAQIVEHRFRTETGSAALAMQAQFDSPVHPQQLYWHFKGPNEAIILQLFISAKHHLMQHFPPTLLSHIQLFTQPFTV